MSRRERLSQTKVLNLKQKPVATKIALEAISSAHEGYTNYNQIIRRILGVFVQPTSFFSHLMVTGVAATVLVSTIWTAGVGQAVSGVSRADVQVDPNVVPITVATLASASDLQVPVAEPAKPQADQPTADTGFLKAPSSPATDRKGVLEPVSYTVQGGDTLASVAAAHNISVDTLLSANGLRRGSLLHPGQTLTLLPVSGALFTANGGETLDAVASKYGVDVKSIVAANDVDQDKPLAEGVKLVIPGGTDSSIQEAAPTRPTVSTLAAVSSGPIVGNSFPYGQCTYYVATRRNVSWSGNAWQWYGNARAMGYHVGQTPVKGAIYVGWDSPYYGHVAYVESVNADGSYTISEMNYAGWGVKDYRTIYPGEAPLIGFIY